MITKRYSRHALENKGSIREIVPLYLLSRKDSQTFGEHERWLESYYENCTCARNIEIAIKDAYAENALDEFCAEAIILKYGFDRVNWVLAHTIQSNNYDTRFSQEQCSWAKAYPIPYDDNYLQRNCAVGLHPSLVSLFVALVLEKWKDLKLYDSTHCYDESNEKLDYHKKVVVVKPHILQDGKKRPEYQLFFAERRKHLSDSEDPLDVCFYSGRSLKTKECKRLAREDIIGVMKLDLLPEWARERYVQLTEIPRDKRIQIGESEIEEESLYLRPTRR